MSLRQFLPIVLLFGVVGCSVKEAACGKTAPAAGPETAAPEAITGDVSDPNARPKLAIAYLGDSLTAGLGLLSNQTFPAKIEDLFTADGYSIETINGGISGDTSAGGLRRVEQLLEPNVKILVVALGGNDALRGLTVAETKENLRQIIDIAQGRGVLVMLCGMEAPTNLGEDYRTAFKQLYFDLLRSYQRQIVYVPFLLEGVAGKPELNQEDGIHPNEAGSKVIADTLFPLLRGMVDRAGGGV